ncbi:hypothetical protein VCUG_00507 [Vavraia culicis subsp. floridensis]|uniref:Uncharacterized protein n=1 Tax=Vavraia culicis (isolate floridensis) TaxID=948595 RepID=L2GWS5_VAVCU|nr:uncharacterized protein VCUG_00507 [Vavraia culicis subsp. floridensis]ELA48084.1 hypothetical protein VCUG_00507 [Vavraia culicis subsp. floridensis]
MQNDGKKERKMISRDYLNNLNPYAFLNHYDPEKTLDAGKLAHLEATRRIQPEMTPLADIDCLGRESEVLTDKMINMIKNEIIEEMKCLLTENGLNFDEIYQEKTGINEEVRVDGKSVYVHCYDSNAIFNIMEDYLHLTGMSSLCRKYHCAFLYKKQRRLHEKVFRGFNDVLTSKRYVPKEIHLPIPKEISNLSEALIFKTIVDRYKEELQQTQRERRTFINSHILECYLSFVDHKKKRKDERDLHYESVKKLKDALLKED